jgi:hypothetical protein
MPPGSLVCAASETVPLTVAPFAGDVMVSVGAAAAGSAFEATSADSAKSNEARTGLRRPITTPTAALYVLDQ